MADGQIVISTKIDTSGIDKGTKEIENKSKKTGKSVEEIGNNAEKEIGKKSESASNKASNALSSIAKKGAKIAVAGITAVSGAIGVLAKESVEQYSQYEQLTGGVETLFKNSANIVENYAAGAFRSAGLSANEYMNTITGFSASLLQGLGGDTEKAARIGNQAVIDMSDNANKMGSNMQDIQNAYQGFAKQNYTMLDNLKLGYGGTKEEMQRLLQDAEKLTGRKFDLSNFSDIIEAIHAIQQNMDITGTTAKEAATTIEGSLNMTKAAWKNLLTSMANDNDDVFEESINDLVYSVGAFSENVLPRVEIAINGIGKMIDSLLPPIVEKLPDIVTSIVPQLLNAGVNLVLSLVNGIVTALPQLAEASSQLIVTIANRVGETLPQLITSLVQALSEFVNTLVSNVPMLIEAGGTLLQGLADGLISGIDILLSNVSTILENITGSLSSGLPMLLEIGMNLMLTLINGISEVIPQIGNIIPQIIDILVTFLSESLPQIAMQGVQIILELINGINQCLPELLQQLPTIIQSILIALINAMPTLINAGIQIITTLIGGLVQAIPQLISYIPQIVQTILSLLIVNLPLIISGGIQIITSLVTGLINALPQLISYIPTIVQTIVDIVSRNLPMILATGIEILIALINGLAQALPDLIGYLPSIVSAIWNAFWNVDWLELGWNILIGIGKGIEDAVKDVVNMALDACGSILDSIQGFFDIHSPSRLMRDLIGKNIMKGIGVGVELETPNLQDQIQGNLEGLVGTMQATVRGEIASTTAGIVASNITNITNNNVTNAESGYSNIPNDRGTTVNKYYVDGREFMEALAPYADSVMEEWRSGR